MLVIKAKDSKGGIASVEYSNTLSVSYNLPPGITIDSVSLSGSILDVVVSITDPENDEITNVVMDILDANDNNLLHSENLTLDTATGKWKVSQLDLSGV